MLRILFLFLLLLSCWQVNGQVDPYDQYLNQRPEQRPRRENTRNRPAFADLYLQEIGASFNFFTETGGQTILPGIQYIGRYNLREIDDKRALSISGHPSLGFQADPFFGTFFMLNFPVMIESTFGRGSTQFNENAVGLSLGLGPEFNLLNRFNQFGISAAATFRFQLGGRSYFIRYGTSVAPPTKNVFISSVSFGNSLF